MNTRTFNTWTRDGVTVELHDDGERFTLDGEIYRLKSRKHPLADETDTGIACQLWSAVSVSDGHPVCRVEREVWDTLPHLSQVSAAGCGVTREGKPDEDPRYVAALVIAEIV